MVRLSYFHWLVRSRRAGWFAHHSCLSLPAKGGLGRSWELKRHLTPIQDGSFTQNVFSSVPSYILRLKFFSLNSFIKI